MIGTRHIFSFRLIKINLPNNFAYTDLYKFVFRFVNNHYIIQYLSSHHNNHDDHEPTPAPCDWMAWMEKGCHDYHVPDEMCCAIIDCGAAHIAIALGINNARIEQCNLTQSVLGTQMVSPHDFFGKRESVDSSVNDDPGMALNSVIKARSPPPLPKMCLPVDVNVLGKRDVGMDIDLNLLYSVVRSVPRRNATLVNTTTPGPSSSANRSTSHYHGKTEDHQPLIKPLAHWCQRLSR